MARTIVLGNERGGCGNSTIAIHVVALLLRDGSGVGVIDLDVRQRSMLRFFENREQFAERRATRLVMPTCRKTEPSESLDRAQAEEEDCVSLANAIADLGQTCEHVVIDTPGASTPLTENAHRLADILVSPINDSFVDFDVLARVNAANGEIEGPSVYARAVWSARQWRIEHGQPPTEWIVMRNRIASLEARNQRRVRRSLDKLAARMGFRVAMGFSERVIFRELFLNGLTLLDLSPISKMARFSMSHVAARQELRDLAKELGVGSGSI